MAPSSGEERRAPCAHQLEQRGVHVLEGDVYGTLTAEGAIEGDDGRVHRLMQHLQFDEYRVARRLIRIHGHHLEGEH